MAAQYHHKRNADISPAMRWAKECLQSKGKTPRQYLNALVFLAPDEQALDGLLDALAERRAWQKIVDERLQHNLTANQDSQAAARIEQATTKIHARIPETWCHLLIPYQSEPGPDGALWEEKRLNGAKGSLPERASKKCSDEDLLFEEIGARAIRDKLNAFLWAEKPHVEVRELADWCKRYLYLPRLASDEVLLRSLVNGTAALSGEETFHLADAWDAESKRYVGLRHQSTTGERQPNLNSSRETDVASAQADLQAQHRVVVSVAITLVDKRQWSQPWRPHTRSSGDASTIRKRPPTPLL